MIDNHKVELEKTKEEYTKLKRAMDELRASEVCNYVLLSGDVLIDFAVVFFPQPSLFGHTTG